MRCPSEYFLSRFLTFHSISAGGFFDPPPKYTSYSTLRRRSWSSSSVSSSSTVKSGGSSTGSELTRNIPHHCRASYVRKVHRRTLTLEAVSDYWASDFWIEA